MAEKSDFIHLHTHSHFSLLQGLTKIPHLVKRAKEYGMDALALTDYGAMYGSIEFYKECRKNEIKPILGIDAYMAFRTMEDKDHGIDNKRYPFTLLAKDHAGYNNLLKLVTRSYVKGFYYRPRMDKELLRQYQGGLVCMSGPIFGELGQAVLTKNFDKAKNIIREYQDIFGKENYFVELMFNGHFEGLEGLNRDLTRLAQEMGAGIVATQNAHYLDPSDREAFDTLIGISTTGVRAREGFMQGDFAFYDAEEMKRRFDEYPEAVENTRKIAEMCNLEIDLDAWHFPTYPIPEGKTYDDVLREQTYAGIEKRGIERTAEIEERIDYELEVIKNKGYSSYFLIVADMLQEGLKKGIYTNTRGSAAGSLVSYLNFITKVNPIALKLPFERFMNPERPGIPDIDMDIADDRRDELIDYLREKYGNKAVAQIGTFGKMMARGSVRDVARAMGYSYEEGDKIAKLIPMGSQGFPMTIDRAIEEEKDLKKMYDSDQNVQKIIEMAKKIEGCARHISVHAAGVVISPSRVDDYSPVQMDPKGGKIITQYDMYTGDRDGVVNLPKFDVLGIRNLAILANSVKIVKQVEDIDIDLDRIPIDDEKTFRMLSEGKTTGVFQLSGGGMTRFLVELKPSTIHDINAMVALYRPGPMESIPEYIERKHNPKKIKYMDERMKDILAMSHGVITYQDDVLLTAITLAGYSWLEADKLRKAMGKKIPEEMAKQKEKFLSGCVEHGMEKKKAEEIWALIAPFAGYGFNKAHAASYGRIAYETAYMKANYPVEYMTAMLTAESGDVEKVAEIIHECESTGIEVLPPDVNECFSDFTVVKDESGNKIRFGFNTIKNFGQDIARAIVVERKARGKFKDMQDFLDRIDHKNLNKKSLEALVMSGAMDKFGERMQLLHNMERLLQYRRDAGKRDKDQGSLFGDMAVGTTLTLEECVPATDKQKLAWEKELLGLYVSGHPLDPYKTKFENGKWNVGKILAEGEENERIIAGGIVAHCKIILTKKNHDKMAFVTLEDFTGSIEAVVFPRVYEEYAPLLAEDTCIIVKGKISGRNGERSIIIEGVKKID